MQLMKSKLGLFIKEINERNSKEQYDLNCVKGISTQKKFIETKADMEGVSLKSYKIVMPGDFAYVSDTSRRGDKISLAYNLSDKVYLVSSISTVFRTDSEKINPLYLFMYFNRSEFDRFSRFNSWGSARETFTFDDLCDIEIELPEIDIQNKYADVYKGMLDNQKAYETGLEDLKLTCDAYIENCGMKEFIGDNIAEYSKKNIDGRILIENGVSITKEFIETKASASDITKQKVVDLNTFAFNANTSRNSDKLSIALNTIEPCIVSTSYITFKCNERLNPKYLFMWFKRNEFDRYCRFNSWGSARETISLNEIKEYMIPIPSIEIQQDIVNIYDAYIARKEINDKMKELISNVCPILIRSSKTEVMDN